MDAYPVDLQQRVLPSNTPASRWALSGRPPQYAHWSFATWPGSNTETVEWLKEWASLSMPDPAGVILWGPAGTGKSGLMLSTLRVRAEEGDGSRAMWNLLTYPSAGSDAVHPAPCWFESWLTLRGRLRRAPRFRVEGSESPSEEQLVLELAEDVSVLAMDDIDIDGMTPWKEAVLLTLLARVEHHRRVLLTVNTPPTGFLDRFGERLADRLLDRTRFALLACQGESLRRR